MNRIKAFICYSDKDKIIAGKIKSLFETCVGFECFLAHDTLNPSDNWPQEILKNLRKTDIVVPLISKHFLTSSFANQEIGLALAYGKRIVPISLDGTNPIGFIDNLQAHKCHNSYEYELLVAVTHIFSLFAEHPKFTSSIQDAFYSLISAFEKSSNFRTTSIIIGIMIEVDKKLKFSNDQILKIVSVAKTNRQIHAAVYVMPKLRKFLQDSYNVVIDF